jgi:hypothetical protein
MTRGAPLCLGSPYCSGHPRTLVQYLPRTPSFRLDSKGQLHTAEHKVQVRWWSKRGKVKGVGKEESTFVCTGVDGCSQFAIKGGERFSSLEIHVQPVLCVHRKIDHDAMPLTVTASRQLRDRSRRLGGVRLQCGFEMLLSDSLCSLSLCSRSWHRQEK